MVEKQSVPGRRQARLTSAVLDNGGLDVEELADLLDVSVVTVYRDVAQLEQEGLVRLIRGRVEPAASTIVDLASGMRAQIMMDVKESFASVVSELIPRAASVIVDDSSSCMPSLRELTKNAPLTVITNSLAAIRTVGRSPLVDLQCVGGQYSPWSESFYGPRTVAEIEKLRPDYCLMSDTAISDGDVCNPYDYVAQTKQAMLSVSGIRMLLADHTKFKRRALYKTADIGLFQYLITDKTPPDPILTMCRDAGTQIIVAGIDSQTTR